MTLLEDLPEEIIDMILIWLPPKEVGRCRAEPTAVVEAAHDLHL